MRQLPSLAAVRVFEAAGRHENFTAAAAELGMTQAAVSYQVRVLEERLGLPLFRREKKRVVLTEPGRRALDHVTGAFDRLDAAFAGLRAEDESVLTISSSNTFANTWLAWYVGGFQLDQPQMAVKLQVEDTLVDFASAEVDVAIRSGGGGWPGLAEHELLRIDYTPMCSPGFLARHGGTLTPQRLLDLPQISPGDSWWTHWLREAGVTAPEGKPRPGIRLDSQANEGHAAMAGQGVAMLTPFLWKNDVAEGRLVMPFAQVSQGRFAYWLVYPEHRRRVRKIARFRDWLLATLAADSARA